MEETTKNLVRDASQVEFSVTPSQEDRVERMLSDECDPPPSPPENEGCSDREASNSLTFYLKGLKACARKKRRRCISGELDRIP